MDERDLERLFRQGQVHVVQVGHWRCWEWTTYHDHRGYGRFWLNGKYRPAHRVFREYVNPRTLQLRHRRLYLPEETPVLDHLCNNRPCIRHLNPTTQRKNHQERANRYWANKARRTARTVRGLHPLLNEELI